MSIDKIIITGDMLRPSVDGSGPNQKPNIDWIYHLLKFPLVQSTSTQIEVLNWGYNRGAFDSKKIYALNNHKSMPDDWIELYNSDKFSAESLKYIKEYFDNAFVIGFELPEILMKMFVELNINYIDIIIHPVRYLDDIFFGMRTNNNKIFQKIKSYQLHSQVFSIYAGLHTASISRMSKKIRLQKGSALFTGQVEVDKSLIKDGKILSLLDFKNEFSEVAQRYKKVYFKKHPYAESSHKVDSFLRSFKNVEFVDENFYYLLGQEEIEAVYSISSSTVLEAKYWGKESTYFYKSPFNLQHEADFDSTVYIPVYEQFLLPAFWSDILSSVVETKKMPQFELPVKPNRIRNSLQSYWGYNFLDVDVMLKNAESINNLSINCDTDMSVTSILEYLKPEIRKKRKELEGNDRVLLHSTNKTSSFQRFKKLSWIGIKQRIKYLPYVGPGLLYIKHKILK
ncbi:MAG: hypothetical protein KZQ70_08200 [gamma proteobacterium symbiont of Lucinoma myriamae]|nr:hypothetical protein [gamma proteobacterium symbiont of Lucinoma myriamae]MCU7819654.1 hypothetical protein [gamma proteobacterium symbiont of Lucinoma myriamae]